MNWKINVARRIVALNEKILPRIDRRPAQLAPRGDLTALLQTLHPVVTQHELVRMGAVRDGGYLVPNDLDGVIACYSPGVGPVSDFELDCARRGMKVFLADGSVDGPASAHLNFQFLHRFIGSFEDELTTTVDQWVADTLKDEPGDLLFQMDIEGSEYEVIHSLSPQLMSRFRVILVECHSLDGLFELNSFHTISRAFQKLLATHACVHAHPNNYQPLVCYRGVAVPKVAEFTFHRRDRVSVAGYARTFPHPLDRDNVDRPTAILPRSMYRDASPD